MEEVVACFSSVVDPRQENIRHDLHEVLMIALCTMLSGGEDCSDMALFGAAKEPFLRKFLRLSHGIPSHDTFSRLFRRLDPVPFQACFVRYMERFAATLSGVVAIDGKTLRRSFDRAAGKSPLHMVHAWAVDQRLLLGQMAVDAKSNVTDASTPPRGHGSFAEHWHLGFGEVIRWIMTALITDIRIVIRMLSTVGLN